MLGEDNELGPSHGGWELNYGRVSHDYKLDKSHIFAVNMLDNLDRFVNVKEEWESPITPCMMNDRSVNIRTLRNDRCQSYIVGLPKNPESRKPNESDSKN